MVKLVSIMIVVKITILSVVLAFEFDLKQKVEHKHISLPNDLTGAY